MMHVCSICTNLIKSQRLCHFWLDSCITFALTSCPCAIRPKDRRFVQLLERKGLVVSTDVTVPEKFKPIGVMLNSDGLIFVCIRPDSHAIPLHSEDIL